MYPSILNTAPVGARCSPAHALFALAYAVRCDNEFHLFRGALRSRLIERLQSDADAILRSQEHDGALLLPRAQATSRATDLEGRLSETAHHLEWLHLCPEEVRIDPAAVARAIIFIGDTATEQRVESLRMTYCTASHCARAHALWRRKCDI